MKRLLIRLWTSLSLSRSRFGECERTLTCNALIWLDDRLVSITTYVSYSLSGNKALISVKWFETLRLPASRYLCKHCVVSSFTRHDFFWMRLRIFYRMQRVVWMSMILFRWCDCDVFLCAMCAWIGSTPILCNCDLWFKITYISTNRNRTMWTISQKRIINAQSHSQKDRILWTSLQSSFMVPTFPD